MTAKKKAPRLKSLLVVILGLALLGLAIQGIFGRRGYLKIQELQDSNQDLTKKIEVLKSENARTMEEIQALVGMEEEDQATEWGRVDSREINWMYLGLKNSLAGRGRQMFANVLTSVYKQVTGFMDRLTGGPGQSAQNNAQGDGRQN